jgi:hypothetical protein
MLATFDLFRAHSDGSVEWLGVFPKLEAARKKIQELQASSSGEYFVFNQETGDKLYFTDEDRTDISASSEGAPGAA